MEDLLEKAVKLYTEGKPEESLEILEEILSKGPNLDAAVWKANILMGMGNFEEAISFFSSQESEYGDNPMYWTQLGYLHLMSNDPLSAIQNFDKATEISENFFYAHLGEGYAHYLLMVKAIEEGNSEAIEEELSKGMESLENARKFGADEKDVEVLEGMIFEAHGDLNKAWEKYSKAISLGSKDAVARLRALAISMRDFDKIKEAFSGDPKEMVKEGLKLELSGDSFGAMYLYYAAIKLGEAKELGMRTLDMASSYGEVDLFEDLASELGLDVEKDEKLKRKFGECLIRGGKLKEGIEKLEEVKEHFKGDPHFMGFLAFSYYDSGDEIKALETLLDSVDESGESPEPWLYLSLYHFDRKEYEKAMKAAEEALKRKPDMAEAKYLIMLCKKKMGADYSEEEKWLSEQGLLDTLSEYFGEDMRGS